MFVRFLLPFLALLATVSCAVRPAAPVAGPGDNTLPSGDAASRWVLYYGTLSRAFARIHCGNEVLQLNNYRLASGFSQTEAWRFWTASNQAVLEFLPPPSMLKKDLILEIPQMDFAFKGPQQKIQAEFLVGGKPLLKHEFTPKSPVSLQLKIPAALNQAKGMTLTIRINGIRRQSELGGTDPRRLGIGFRFLKDDILLFQAKVTKALFRIEKISPPDPQGIQTAELRLMNHYFGPRPQDVLKTGLHTAALEADAGIRQYRKGDYLELFLQNGKGAPVIIAGGPVLPEPAACGLTDFSSCFPEMNTAGGPSVPENVRTAQKQQIMADLPGVRNRLKNLVRDRALDERFQRVWLQLQKKLEPVPRVFSPDDGQEIERFQNLYFWGTRRGSFFALPGKFVFAERKSVTHNITALLSIRDLLKAHGIQLIVLLRPDADQIAARALVPAFSRTADLTSLQCTASLLEFGLETVFADDEVMAVLPSAERFFCYPSNRPEAALWKVLAGLTAKRLERFGKDAFKEADPAHYSEKNEPTAFGKNYRWPEKVSCGEHKNDEIVESLRVYRNGQPFRPDPKSEILVMGGRDLRYPGPGHTFAEQLSFRLKYPVDELVIDSESCLPNLPAELSCGSARYLTGKKVCILALPAKILADDILPDLRQRQEIYRHLRGRKAVHNFKWTFRNDDPKPPVYGPQDRERFEKWLRNRDWMWMIHRNRQSVVRIRETGQLRDFVTLAIPRANRGKPSTLVIEAACFPGQATMLVVNNEKIPLMSNGGTINYYPAAVELPPGTREVKLKFSGRRDNLILVRGISLYQ